MVGVELMVGGWFASPVIKSVFDKAHKYLGANYELQEGIQGMVKELTITLALCEATVMEVEKRTIINNRALADWLRMLKETVYDAEDVLDNMEKVHGKNKVNKLASSSLCGLRNMFPPTDHYRSLEKVVDNLKRLSIDIPTILRLVNMNENNESQTHEVTGTTETISQPLEEVGLHGRQEEFKQILDIVLGSESESSKKGGQNSKNYRGLLVIPIVGMGGVGKTALAQAVYNNPHVKQTFATLAWISVSNNLDLVLLMRKIFQSLSEYPISDYCGSQIPLEYISKRITSIIAGGKFLIVLDDMFEKIEYQWEHLYRTLSGGAPGSVVLITTQNQVFANRVGTFGPIVLSALDSGTFWELFEHFAFGYQVMPEEKRINLKSIGRKIADKLGGLPLAAKIIGNILRSKMDEDRWRKISKSEWWDIPEGKSRILPSIGVGYEQLDPCLRQCFAYCSIFPRNSLIEKDRLVHMWIAQNFIQSNDNGMKKLEDIGRQWFDELVEKSFLQLAGDNYSYVMQDLMHDLAVIVSSGECFYLNEGLVEIPLGVRHLAVNTNNLEVIKGIQVHKNLRSFLYFGRHQVKGMYSAINDTLSKLDSIRVLDLSYMHMEYNYKPPPAIWNLQHLRFLDLSSTGIKLLTRSSLDLYHLQALYIKKCEFLGNPRGINKLLNLRHLCVDEKTIMQISSIGQLTNLQELGVFAVGKKERHRITELRNLREIEGTLRIKNFENIRSKTEAMLANLVNKKHLDKIYIHARTTQRKINLDMEVLEGLQPHKEIELLEIYGYVGFDFPKWVIQIDNFLNLNTLSLLHCPNVKVLPPLGELPSLKLLHIEKLSSIKLINYHMYGKKQIVFPLLKELVLDTLSNCEEWIDAGPREFFPRLSKLTITNNKTLREAPIHLFRSSLRELIISKCEKLISLEYSIPRLSSLTRLELCMNSTSVSLDPLNMPLLENLYLENCSELNINGDLQSLTHLKRLKLVTCSKLFSTYSTKDLQKGKSLQVHPDEGLRSLTHIEADNSLLHHEYYHQILGSLHSLQVLNFKNIELTRFTNLQRLWFQEMTALQEIHFSNCEFEHLPDSLTLLSSLKKMKLISCTKLESLSADSMPPNLQELLLLNCSQNLVQLCEANKGKDRQFISSILVIHIDDTTNRKGKIRNTHQVQSMAIGKPLSDAIGRHSCASCNKTFELRDLVLRDWWY